MAAFGAAFAFAANLVSPQGLALARDYFPTENAHAVRPAASSGLPKTAGTNSVALTPAQFLAAQMKEKGLQLIDRPQARQLLQDPRFRQNIIVFIDAREAESYQKGHVPGAYEFDPYRSGKYYDEVLPLCREAEKIVVYCNGGDCDDSETAALLLRDMGIPNQKLFVYAGGITEWKTNGLPVETGARNSGILLDLKK